MFRRKGKNTAAAVEPASATGAEVAATSPELPPGCAEELAFAAAASLFTAAHAELMGLRARLEADKVAAMATDLAASAQELGAAAEEVSSSVQHIHGMHEELQRINRGHEQGMRQVEELLARARSAFEATVTRLGEVSNTLRKVNTVGTYVGQIADQTNLLALNAAIEAARAGDAGRGFAVVAAEVRKLAGETKEAVRTVSDLSREIESLSGGAVSDARAASQALGEYEREAGQMLARVRESMRQVEQAGSAVKDISLAVEHQAQAANSLAGTGSELAQAAELGRAVFGDAADLADLVFGHVAQAATYSPGENGVALLGARLADHARFLRQVVAGAGKGITVASHRECAFGRWYEGEGRQALGHLPAFVTLEAPHRAVHEAAAKLAQAATLEWAQELTRASLEFFRSFLALKEAVAGNSR
ncbi:MAG: methyl-accepting chemotaxis protein [Moorellales bacterium]